MSLSHSRPLFFFKCSPNWFGFLAILLASTSFADFIPNDPAFSDQWALTQMRVPAAWDYSMGSLNVKIGILDTGIIFGTPTCRAVTFRLL